jgi:methionyl-tRNA synthetase
MTDPFYVTTAISYPNGRPHVGHAYEAIATDAIARWHRLAGREVRFLTGTDEHGLKMAQAARTRGLEPRALADEMSSAFKAMADAFSISYDRFIRTTDPDHYAASAEIWRRMEAQGDIYLGRYEGWYSVRDEAFYAEEELIDGEGGRLSPQGTPVEWTVEESWFFRLSAYQDRLLAHYEAEPGFIRPDARRNEVTSFVRGGLADLSISRTSFDWGVPVPGAPGHVMYVWVDALTNYLTGAGWPYDEGMAAKWWPASLHVIGKDIVRFHAVYWPAFLMSAGLPLPRAVFGHGFVLHRGEKMSKSAGNVADPHALVERYGVDPLRYFLLREVSFGQDGGYSDEAIVTRVNADLANGLGNLAQRCLSMIGKQCGGIAPACDGLLRVDVDLLEMLWVLKTKLQQEIDSLAPHAALAELWTGVSAANGYFAEQAPWAVRKSDPARADRILWTAAEAVRQLAILVRWAIPGSADALLDQLGQEADARDFAALAIPLRPGTVLPPPNGVFPRLEVAAE